MQQQPYYPQHAAYAAQQAAAAAAAAAAGHRAPYPPAAYPPAAYPQAAGYAPPVAYPPAPAYYNPHAAYGVPPAIAYGGVAPAPVAVPAVAEEVPVAAPLSPISQARAREAELAALSLAQAAAPAVPAFAGAKQHGSAGDEEAEEGEREPDPNALEMKLENAHYNLNEVLGANLVAHAYWKDLARLTTLDEVVDEIYAHVKHVELMVAGKDRLPSTACFLLYKLFTLDPPLDKRQMHDLLRPKDSVYIRALGFLYLRCVTDSKGLWHWFQPFLSDPTPLQAAQQDPEPTTLGAWLRGLLASNDYFGTKLKRIPIPVQRDYELKLAHLAARTQRGERNEPFRASLTPGLHLQAEYHVDNKFYDAVIERVDAESGKFFVRFTEYGNVEEVDIGSLRLPASITDAAASAAPAPRERDARAGKTSEREPSRDREAERRRDKGASRDRDRDRDRRSRDRSRDRDRDRDRDRRRRISRSRSRTRSRSRDRYRSSRSHRDRRSRSRSRDRHRRRSYTPSRSRSRSPGSSSRARDVFSDLLADTTSRGAPRGSSSRGGARSPSPEVSLEALRRRDREKAVAQGKQYARPPSTYKDNLSMASLSATTRKRSRSPPPRPRDTAPALPTVDEDARRKPQLSEEQKAARAKLMAKYGDAASQKDLAMKRANRKDDEDADVIRLGL